MAKEFLWRNDEVAAENRASAQTQTALAAPPKDAALRLTAGHSVHIDNSDATGYFIAINIKTGEKLVFTSHSPHEEARSTRPGTVDVGQHEFNDLVLLCSPAHPVVYQTGSAGFHAIKPEISPDQLAVVEAACHKHGLPYPVIGGRTAAAGSQPAWSILKF